VLGDSWHRTMNKAKAAMGARWQRVLTMWCRKRSPSTVTVTKAAPLGTGHASSSSSSSFSSSASSSDTTVAAACQLVASAVASLQNKSPSLSPEEPTALLLLLLLLLPLLPLLTLLPLSLPLLLPRGKGRRVRWRSNARVSLVSPAAVAAAHAAAAPVTTKSEHAAP